MKLSNLQKIKKARKRVGRGGAHGGTSCRGSKGQKARSGGKVRPLFEGGQMPLFRRLPKRGFCNERFTKERVIVNLTDLERCFTEGDTVNHETLCEKGLLKLSHRKSLLKVLGNGEIKKALKVYAHQYSASAVEAIKKHKGEVHLLAKEQ